MTPSEHFFHESPFDSGTIIKLEILEDYLKEWLPVFLNNRQTTDIHIYDFFCGPGHDVNQIPGSPKRIYSVINQYINKASPKNIHIWFNDRDATKVDMCRQIPPPTNVKCTFTSQNAEKCFLAIREKNPHARTAHFFFIDPCGLLDYKNILEIVNELKVSDSLLFIPGSFISRFYEHEAFSKKLPGFPASIKPAHLPKEFCKYCKQQLGFANVHFAPFTIRKNTSSQIHGLIFMSKHPYGLEKFLNVTWKKSKNGEANFTITGDLPDTKQLFLHDIFSMSNKIPEFQKQLRDKILSGTLKTNKDVYLFSILHGHLPQHAKDVLKNLHHNGKILKNLPISYKSAWCNTPIDIQLL